MSDNVKLLWPHLPFASVHPISVWNRNDFLKSYDYSVGLNHKPEWVIKENEFLLKLKRTLSREGDKTDLERYSNCNKKIRTYSNTLLFF